MHKSLHEFEFWPDSISDYGVSCTGASNNRHHHFLSFAIDPIIFKVAGNEDMHDSLDGFEIQRDRIINYGVTCL